MGVCIVKKIDCTEQIKLKKGEEFKCEVCKNIFILNRNYKNRSTPRACSIFCRNEIEKLEMRMRKLKQRDIDDKVQNGFRWDLESFDKAFLMEKLVLLFKKDSKSVNSNILVLRNALKKFGEDSCQKMFSEYYIKYPDLSFQEYIYLFQNGYRKGECVACGKETKYRNDLRGYQKYCSAKCSNTEIGKIEKSNQCTDRSKQKEALNRKAYEKYIKELDQTFKVVTSFEDFKNHKRLEVVCNVCNKKTSSFFNYVRCYSCNPKKYESEKKILEDLKLDPSVKVFLNKRGELEYKRLELDLYFPDYKVAIEFDGSYWHSDVTDNKKYNHLIKLKECQKAGIKLIRVQEYNFLDKKQIYLSIIRNALKLSDNRVQARKCVIKIPTSIEVKEFLNTNHIQGYVPSKINLGLYHNDELVHLQTFGNSRFSKSYNWELHRLCTKLNTVVSGGASKLFKYFIKTYLKENEIVVSYCDNSYATGLVYETLGFRFLKETPPNYVYLDKKCSYVGSRQRFQKHKLSGILENYNENLTEKKNMFNNGYRVLYDCGNKVFVYG